MRLASAKKWQQCKTAKNARISAKLTTWLQQSRENGMENIKLIWNVWIKFKSF